VAFTHDILIIGQGLAGTVLSETLAARGARVALFDAPLDGRASWVAAGVVNPIVLRRTVPSWRASELLAIAGPFYRDLQQRYERPLWHPVALAAIFPTAQEAGIWQLRLRDEELSRMMAPGRIADAGLARLPQPYGHGAVLRSAWLDTKALLRIHGERSRESGSLMERHVLAADIHETPDGIAIGGFSAPHMVHCAGPFAQVPGLVPVRGEGLTVRMPGLGLGVMVHRGIFILPMGDDLYRIGATFAWDDVWSGPTGEGRRHLLDRLQRLWQGEIEVLDHWAGVRPASKDRRPIMGRVTPRQLVLNGLGSRGVLLAPWCAAHLAGHLLNGTPLDPEVDVARFQ
jgi:glycine/D-amino acid oxidase-like deaminating enzyme